MYCICVRACALEFVIDDRFSSNLGQSLFPAIAWTSLKNKKVQLSEPLFWCGGEGQASFPKIFWFWGPNILRFFEILPLNLLKYGTIIVSTLQ